MSELISIIVPIYNTEKYLVKCIESIIFQSYKNIQIILVDDGSTDCSYDICRRYAENDKRILVIHKENGGAVSARKAGLKKAEGDFIGWVDSDDWIDENYFEELINALKKRNADIVLANHYHEIGSCSTIIKNNIPPGLYELSQVISCSLYCDYFFDYGMQPHLVTKLFKREKIEKIYNDMNDKIVIGEDIAVFYPYLLYCDKICITDICGYHYIQHKASVTKSKVKDDFWRTRLLFDWLNDKLLKTEYSHVLQGQINQLKKYIILFRNTSLFSQHGIELYDEVSENNKIIIYGAGGLGQRVYDYFIDKGIDIVKWIDKNYLHYCYDGINVSAPEILSDAKLKYDYILIAVINEKTAESIKKNLIDIGVAENKIKWLSGKLTDKNFILDF